MKIFKKKDKTERIGNSYYFGEFGEIGIGLSVTQMTTTDDIYRDSKHYHKESTEYYLVLAGQATFEVDGKEIIVNKDETLMVEANEIHWLREVNQLPCTIISISTKKLANDKVIVS